MIVAKNPLADRIATNLRFYDIANLGKQIAGGPLGIDFNRAFTADNGPTKVQFANWLIEQSWWDESKALELLPPLEAEAAAYYAKPRRGRPPGSKNKPKPAAPVIEAVPMPQAPQEVTVPGNVEINGADVRQILEAAHQNACRQDDLRQQAQATVMAEMLAKLEAKINVARPILITQQGKSDSVKLDRQHKEFLTLLKLCKARSRTGQRFNVWMTGPAGSGKTTAAMNVAKALSLPFHFCGAINDDYKLTGFIDAHGNLVRTPFREAFEHGGVFLLDEIDGCNPGVILALNAALANGTCDFADGNIKRHDDCIIIAAANTWGLGATHKYVGRNKLDAASLDRFKPIAWDYDEDMERDISGNVQWARKVQGMRANMMRAGIEAVISPRATYDGADMLAQGFTEAEVIEVCVRKGMPAEQWQQVSRSY